MRFTHSASTGRLRFVATLLLGTMLVTAAAQAETLTVTGIEQPGEDAYTLSIPTVEVTDGNLTEAQVRELFQVTSLDDLGKWAKLSAKSLKIPEITAIYTVPTGVGTTDTSTETITYRNIALNDVVDGVAGSTEIAGADIVSSSGGNTAMNMTLGKMSSGRFDIGAMLALYGIGVGTAAPASELKEVYSSFTFEGGNLTTGEVRCDFGAGEAGRFLARPLKTSMSDLQAVIKRMQQAQTDAPSAAPAPEDVRTLVSFYTDLLTAFASDPTYLRGFDCAGTDPTTGQTFKLAMGDIDIGGFEPAVYPKFSLGDFSFEGNDGFLKFGNFTWKKMDLHGPIAALDNAPQLDEAWFTANWRKLVPAMDGLSIADVSFDLPDSASPGQRSRGEAGLFDITLGKYINGLPSEIAVALDDATLPLPPELSAGPAAAQLAARGVTEIRSDTHVKLHWDEASNTILLDELLSDADQLFRIAVTGTIGNATPALFSSDESEALTASLGLTVKDLTVDLEDRGFYGLVLAVSAAEGGQPMQSTRTALSGMVQGMTLAILGSDESALAAVGELGKFLSGAHSKVSITLTAKDSAGFSLSDLAALEKDPTALAGKVTVTATASGDPVPQVEAPATPAAPAEPEVSPAEPELSLGEQKRDLKAPAQP